MESLTLSHKWSCEYCTYENWPATKKCVLCRAPKPPQFIDEDVPVEQDIYKMAPVVCPEGMGPCSSHSTASFASQQSTHDASHKWNCQTCTYLNWPKATKCTQCLTPRPRSAAIISTTQPLSIDVNVSESGVHTKNSPSSPDAAKAVNNDKNRTVTAGMNSSQTQPNKWSCKSCTYDNWIRSLKCVLCGMTRSRQDSVSSAGPSTSEKERSPVAENALNRLGGMMASKKRSPMSSTHSLSESVDIHTGGAMASPNIYQQIEKHINPEFSSNFRANKKYDRNMRQFRNHMRDLNWLWLNACQGIVDGDTRAAEAYLAAGGEPTRQLTQIESDLLCRPSAFTPGHTLIHLAIRFHREDILALLLAAPETVSKARKRVPSCIAPEIAAEIMRDVSRALRQRKGDFPCYFLTDYSTFSLPADIEDLPDEVRKQLFEELLDNNVQKELEDDEPVINWSSEITDRLGSRLYPLWNRTAGDCLLDSVLQASWGIMDRDNTLRRALADSMNDGAMQFYRRWKETESKEAQMFNFSLEESQWEHDWAILLSLASQPGASLAQVHIFALAHILRRPIIVYGIKYVKSYHGDNIGLARFQGVYLPLFWEQSFCWHNPIALGYTRGHFSALVPMEVDVLGNIGAQANISNNDDDDDVPVAYLPLVDSDGNILPIHFLQSSEIGHEQSLLHEWLNCLYTEGGLLVAKQSLTRTPILLRQMIDEWLRRYRGLAKMVKSASVMDSSHTSAAGALSSDEDTDDE